MGVACVMLLGFYSSPVLYVVYCKCRSAVMKDGCLSEAVVPEISCECLHSYISCVMDVELN